MIKPNNDIREEMYGFLYGVTSTPTENTTPIYRTYAKEDTVEKKTITGSEDITTTDATETGQVLIETGDTDKLKLNKEKKPNLEALSNQFAKFPSDDSLKSMASAFGLKQTYTTSASKLLKDKFNDLLQHQNGIIKQIF